MTNDPGSSLTHFIGFLLSVAGLVVLVVFAAQRASAWHVVSFSVFGASMVLLYLASSVYHIIPATRKARLVMRRVDHAMIYVLIAGTYTPVCLVTLRGGWGWSLFGVIWGLALLGVLVKGFGLRVNRVVNVLLYLGMGWLVVIASVPLVRALPLGGLSWLLLGGLCYTVGVLFFALDLVVPRTRWVGMHEVWHLCVMAGTFSHFWLMLRYVLPA